MKADKEYWYTRGKFLVLLFLICLALWIVNWLLPIPDSWLGVGEGKYGEFGEKFGAVNALFSSLAFAALLVAVLLQMRGLSEQREQLRGTEKAMKQQSFETSFFNMLKLLSELTAQMMIRTQGVDTDYWGRECFEQWYGKFKYEFNLVRGQNKGGEVAKLSKEAFDKARLDPKIGYYFRTFYHIIKFVDRNADNKAREYTSVVRAQLSSHQLALLFYNCLIDRGVKLKALVEKYGLLEGMNLDLLVDENHKHSYHPSAFA
jgi:hypothetical protein